MFLTPAVLLLISKATLRTDPDNKGERIRVADLSLVMEPLSYELAQELGLNIADHLFDAQTHEIRDELEDVTVNPRVVSQRIDVLSAPDAPVLATLRYASILDLSVKKIVSEKTGTAWLKATLGVRIDLAEREVREFLFHHFGELRRFTFTAEQMELDGVTDRVMSRVKTGLEGIRPKDTAVSFTTVNDGREVGTHIDKEGNVSEIDRPAKSRAH